MEIKIIIRNKIAKLAERYVVGVCGNSDYIINFDFDTEWDEYETKTARFKHSGTYIDVVFTGNKCNMPVIKDTYNVEIGVFAGDLHTTTSALLPMKKSILCGGGSPEDPAPDVYNQIMDKLNNLDTKGYEELNKEIGDLSNLETEAKDNLVAAVNEAAKAAGGTDISLGLTSASVGQIIKVKAVDENGKPTEWEAADVDKDFELIANVTISEPVSSIEVNTPEGKSEFILFARGKWGTEPSNKRVGFKINGRWYSSSYQIANAWRYFKMRFIRLSGGYIWFEQQSNNMPTGGNIDVGIETKNNSGIYEPCNFLLDQEITKVSFSMINNDGTLNTGFQFMVFAR